MPVVPAFLEILFPTDIAYGSQGGPEFSTDIVELSSGHEQRIARWAQGRARYDVSFGVRTPDQLRRLVAFFRVVHGRATGFRFKDHLDHRADLTEGVVQQDTNGHWRLYKRYEIAGNIHDRTIYKPVQGTVVLTGGAAGGGLDFNTGIISGINSTGTWAGEFHVPCRFDVDHIATSFEAFEIGGAPSIKLVEIRPQ